MFSGSVKKKKSKLEEIYDTYGSFIYHVALRYLGDVHLAQDCTQQSMERLAKYLDRLGETEAKETKSYIYRLAVSTALNMKKQQERYLVKEDAELMYLVDRVQNEDEIERVLSQAESREALRQAEENLSAEEKILLTERYGRERTCAQIAETMGISEAACRKRLQRTREHLAKLLGYQTENGQKGKENAAEGGRRADKVSGKGGAKGGEAE